MLILVEDGEPLSIIGPQRQNHTSARLELLEQSQRWLVGGSGHQNFVIRRVLGSPARAVTNAKTDCGVAKPAQSHLSHAGKFLDNLDTPHPAGKLRQDGGE
jgi:hypothetical protein